MNINVSALISKMNHDYNLNFYFYNIDGNKSNFDTLAGGVQSMLPKLRVIIY